MKFFEIEWKENGWIKVQDADAEKHVIEISCLAENGSIVEVRTRHNDGEEQKGTVSYKGKNALPMELAEFKKLLKKGALDIQ